MSHLVTYQIKPNPLGKDRVNGVATPAQLGAEWVDIKNCGDSSSPIDGIFLCHVAYSSPADSGKWVRIVTFNGSLGAGQTMRIHSGSGPSDLLYADDIAGADVHLFTRQNFIWNNDRSDSSGLFIENMMSPFDVATYALPPREGAILVRVGNELLDPAATLRV